MMHKSFKFKRYRTKKFTSLSVSLKIQLHMLLII